jgi:hypothetical protein
MKEFKFFQKNRFKNKCRLDIGTSFIYNGYYCIVTRMHQNGFLYLIQELEYINYMSYEEYLTTPSAAGRQLNR